MVPSAFVGQSIAYQHDHSIHRWVLQYSVSENEFNNHWLVPDAAGRAGGGTADGATLRSCTYAQRMPRSSWFSKTTRSVVICSWRCCSRKALFSAARNSTACCTLVSRSSLSGRCEVGSARLGALEGRGRFAGWSPGSNPCIDGSIIPGCLSTSKSDGTLVFCNDGEPTGFIAGSVET